MYLFVFIFVIMSVLGLYTELFTLRMSQLMSRQKPAAETMMLWHGAANYFVRDKMATLLPIPATGCTLTNYAVLPTIPACATMFTASFATYLPLGYQSGDTEMQFESRLYSSGASTYLVTFIPAGTTKLGFSTTQISQQMKNAGLPLTSYGYVANGTCMGGAAGTWLMTNAFAGSVQVCYSVVTGGTTVIPVGSIGIVSLF